MSHGQEIQGPPSPTGRLTEEFAGPPAPTQRLAATPEKKSGLRRFAENLGVAGISLATGIPGIELKRRQLDNETQALQNRGIEAQAESDLLAAQKQSRIEELQRQAFDPAGGARADLALRQLMAENPELGEEAFNTIGAVEQSQREEAARDANEILSLPFSQRRARLLERATKLEAEGRDPSDTLALSLLPEEQQNNEMRIIQAAALTAAQRQTAAGTAQGTPAQVQLFNTLSEAAAEVGPDGQPTRRAIQAQTQLGTRARAGTITGTERISLDEDLTTAVAESQAEIAGTTQAAKTQAQIAAELENAGETAAAAARQAALVVAAQEGEKIKASQVRTSIEAQLLLPDARAGNLEMVTLLNDIRNDPELPNVLGAIEGRIDIRLDPNEAALMAKINQVLGKTFLTAYQSLKGGGPITDREGQAATEAQSRLTDRTVSLDAYQDAIDELIGISTNRLNRLIKKAELPAESTDTDQVTQADLDNMSPEDRALFE